MPIPIPISIPKKPCMSKRQRFSVPLCLCGEKTESEHRFAESESGEAVYEYAGQLNSCQSFAAVGVARASPRTQSK